MRKLWSHKQTGKNCKIDKKKVYPKFLFSKLFSFQNLNGCKECVNLRYYTQCPVLEREKKKKLVVLYAESPAKTV